MSVSNLPITADFRRGILPSSAVNLAYLATKEITPKDITVYPISGQASGNINNFIEGLYFAGYNGVLQGGPKINDENLYVTDKFLDSFDKPLYFIAKSRYFHLDWPIYISGEKYTKSNITISEQDGSLFAGNYLITVEPSTDYISYELSDEIDFGSTEMLMYEWSSAQAANTMWGQRFTLTEEAVVSHMHISIKKSTPGTANAIGFIYDSSLDLVATTEELSIEDSGGGTRQFDFDNAVTLPAGEYWFCTHCDQEYKIMLFATGGTSTSSVIAYSSTPPDPCELDTESTTTNSIEIYISYSSKDYSNGLPTGANDEIPYRIVVYLDTDRPLSLSYNKVLENLTGEVNGYKETLNPYPYFEQDTLTNVAQDLDNSPTFYISNSGGEYSVTVPAEQIVDDRKFEYFYWRIKGQLGSATPQTSSSNTEPEVENGVAVTPEPIADSNLIPSVINIGIYKIADQGYPAEYQPIIAALEESRINILKTKFINPLRTNYTDNKTNYWQVTEEELSVDDNLNLFDVLLIPLSRNDFPYDARLDNWSKQSGKGIIFAFDFYSTFSNDTNPISYPNLDNKWGLYWDTTTTADSSTAELASHPLTDGKCSAYALTESPVIAPITDPYSQTTTFDTVYKIASYNEDKLKNLITALTNTSPAEEVGIAAIYDNRIVALDPYSYVSILGQIRIVNGAVFDPYRFSYGYPYFFGLSKDWLDNFRERITYNEHGLKFLYNTILYLAGGKNIDLLQQSGGQPTITQISNPTTTESQSTTSQANVWANYNTPYVRSWVTTKDSLSLDELKDDSGLVVINNRLMRKLFTGNPQQILQSYISTHNNIDFLTLGDLDAEIEITNGNVTLYQDGNSYYVYTDTNGGVPFEAGVAYPANWVRSDHWLSRKKLTGGTLNTDLLQNQQKQIDVAYVDKEWKAIPTKGTRPVTVPGTPTYPTHSASWHIETTAGGGSAQNVTWTAAGKTLTSSTQEAKRIISSNASFYIKSKELEVNRSTAYAWVYLPQCDKVLSQGSSGSDVSFWQTALKNLGYYSGAIDGKFGPITYNAVLKFQTDHNEILEDGIIGPETGGRIADACATANKFLPNHYTYVSTNNLLDSNSGTYGRRTNPFGTVYATSSLQDYVRVDFSTAVSIKRVTLKACSGPAAGKSWKVTQVTAWAGSTRVVDISPGQTVSPGSEVSIAFPTEVSNIDKLYVHIEASSYYMKDSANAYYWGLEYIQAYGTDTVTSTTSGVATKTGSVSLMPGQSKTVTLPSYGFVWDSDSLTVSGTATATSAGGDNTSWTITDTRTAPSGATGATDSTTITGLDGVKTFAPILPSGASSSDTATLISSHDSSTLVSFYNGSSFVGNSVSVSQLQGSGYTVGVQVHEAAPPSTTTYEEYWYDVWQWVDVNKTKQEWIDNVVSTGHIDLEGSDPPPAFFAYKVYSIKQHDGRLNINLFPPDENLTPFDPWYPKVSFGEFTRLIDTYSNNSGWLAKYPNTTLTAYYSIPHLPWSDAGDFTIKVENEVLTYTGPRTVKTKKSPLLFSSFNDGITQVTITKNGTALSDSDITDISKDGTITLASTIYTSDVIVGTYYIRTTTKDIIGLNLNPYPGHNLVVDGVTYSTYQKIGLPIYVYLLPSFCTNGDGVISDSISTSVLNYTTRIEIFEPTSTYYNELAVLLGAVACTGYVHPEDVVVLDARDYGGGAVEDTTNESLLDIEYYAAKTYPEHGFVIIDVDKADKDKELVLRKAIENNIAAGTIYKIRWV